MTYFEAVTKATSFLREERAGYENAKSLFELEDLYRSLKGKLMFLHTHLKYSPRDISDQHVEIIKIALDTYQITYDRVLKASGMMLDDEEVHRLLSLEGPTSAFKAFDKVYSDPQTNTQADILKAFELCQAQWQ